MADVYDMTERKIAKLLELGYAGVQIWECEWTVLQTTDENVRAFVEGLDLVSPLEPRDNLYGGRTNAACL